MQQGFIVKEVKVTDTPLCIVVSNYSADNEVVLWYMEKPDKTRHDIGVWRIKKRNHATAA